MATTTIPFFSLLLRRRFRAVSAWLFLVLVFTVTVQHRVAVFEVDESPDLVLTNDEDVEGEELLTRLIVVNDVVLPILPQVTPLEGERPPVLVATALSLLAVRGLESRAPPLPPVSA